MNDNRPWEQRMEAVNKSQEPISLVMHKFYSYCLHILLNARSTVILVKKREIRLLTHLSCKYQSK